MSLIHPAILYGLGLAAIPVILHFLLRTKPKKLLFPALQLIVIRRKNNVRRMRLRHLWLLLLRMLVIALLVLAITRPSVPAADYGLSGREWLTLLAVIAAAAGVYFGTLFWWRRRQLSHHDLAYRRTLLRGGAGLGTLLLLGLLVAWPYKNRVLGELEAPTGTIAENVPVAAVFLFDTSLSMAYQQENKTRLEVARQMALDYLGSNLPAGSRVAVADTSRSDNVLFQADLIAAKARMEALAIHPVAVPLNRRVSAALEAQVDDRDVQFAQQESVPEPLRRDSFVREIYLFTDLSASGWKVAGAGALREELKTHPWVNVYVVDVGTRWPINFSVSSLELSDRTVPLGGELFVEAGIDAVGKETSEEIRTVELYLEEGAGHRVKKGQQSARPGEAVEFAIRGLTGPISRGEVRLVSSDPLAEDDVRYFTVAVRPPPEVLVVYEEQAEALFWSVALAPYEKVQTRYRVTSIAADDFQPADLRGPSVVCLVNLERPTDVIWQALERFVDEGGGLLVVAGHPRLNPLAYEGKIAQSLLPGKLLAKLQFDPPERLDLGDLTHPVLAKLDAVGGAAELSAVDVKRYWRVEPYEAASTIVSYTDLRSDPALLERVHGQGRTLLLTTAIGRSEQWADFPAAGWPYFILADQVAHYLARQRVGTLNYVAGQRISVPLDPEHPVNRYLLQQPGSFQQIPGEVPAGQTSVTIDETDRLGNYTLVGADKESNFTSGFSVNPDPAESHFNRLTERELKDFLGEERFDVARTLEDLERKASEGRIGREVFPLVLAIVLIIFCGEHVVANRFYKTEETKS